MQCSIQGDFQAFEDRLVRLVNFKFTDLHREMGQALVNETLDAFKTGTSPEGKAWPESGRVTLHNASRRKGRAKGKTLIDTARLRNSIHAVADADQVEVGTDVIYARIHQLGGETGRNKATKLPARPYLPMTEAGDITPKARELLEKMVEEHIKEAAGL